MANVFSIPRFVFSGENAMALCMAHLESMGTKALIVTDENIVRLGYVKKLTDLMDSANVSYYIYDKINSEPTHTMVDDGVELYKNENCDFLVALGGGSPIDAMKAIAAVCTNGGSICDYIEKKIRHPLPCMCAIATTAGTGSEATKFSIITNTNTNVKMLLNDSKLMVDYAVLDSAFTLTVPQDVTVATGVDALAHALEAYTSLKAFSMSDLYASSAIKRIFENLYEVYIDGNNEVARQEMLLAAYEGGIAIGNASVTILHGMSRPIGALFHVPHGMSNAMLLRVCLDFLKSGAASQLCELSKAIGIYEARMTEEEAAEAFVTATNTLLGKLNIKSPMDFGIEKEEFFNVIPKMATDAMISKSPLNTKRVPAKEDIVELYEKFWNEWE